jgi:hypothetical protein
MVAEKVTVVAGEGEHGIFQQPVLAQRPQHAADGVIDAGNHAAGQGVRLARFQFAGREGSEAAHQHASRGALIEHRLHVRRHRPLAIRVGPFRGHLVGAVHVPVAARRSERRVRVGERHQQKEWPVFGRQAHDRCAGFLRDVRRRVQRLRHGRTPRLRADTDLGQRVLRPPQAARRRSLRPLAAAARCCAHRARTMAGRSSGSPGSACTRDWRHRTDRNEHRVPRCCQCAGFATLDGRRSPSGRRGAGRKEK